MSCLRLAACACIFVLTSSSPAAPAAGSGRSCDDGIEGVASAGRTCFSAAEETMMLQLQGSNNAALRTSEPAGPRVHRPCATLDAPNPSPEQVAQRRSLQDLCRRHPESFEAALAPGFEANYDRFFDSSGWADEAFVNYFGYNGGHGETFINTTEVLIESVHNSSSKPIIVVNFGDLPVPARWTAERFPQLVAFQARGNADFGFNFNKLRAMILAQVRTGIQVDSDTALIRDCEHFFRRTREEVTEAYPYPILP